jgi:alkylation response protein AidB-like acyl-CoA dehydrogenase
MTESARAQEKMVLEVERLLNEHPPSRSSAADFLGAQYDAGLAWVHFDVGFGGLALPARYQPLVNQLLAAENAPRPSDNYVGVHQAAVAVHGYASEDLKRRWLRPAFTNEEYWCQLFSEPGAGSDLAGLSTTALRDGDEWVVNGQKVWTSFAHRARWGILLARTDPNVPKHHGLTFFVLDMRADGVDVRPLRTMDGGHHFNEVFLSDVRVPDRQRLGEVGHGWGVSLYLLSSEREGITEHEPLSSWLLDLWHGRRLGGDLEPVYRDRVTASYIASEVSRFLTLRAKHSQGAGGADNFASVVKLLRNETDQRIHDLVVDLLGPDGMLGDYGWQQQGQPHSAQMRFLWSREFTIGGGTAQIQRNLIGERLLGLPSEPRVDKGVPWREIRRSAQPK